MGLLDSFFGNADQTRALGLLGAGMMRGGFAAGAPMAMDYLAGTEDRNLKRGLLQMQMDEMKSQIEARKVQMTKQQQIQALTQRLLGGGSQPAQQGQLGSGSFGIMPTAAGVPDMPQAAPAGLSGASLNDIVALHAAGGPDLLNAYKLAREGFERKPGTFYENVNGQREYVADPTKGITYQGGRVGLLPGFTDTQTAITLATEAPKTLLNSAATVNLRPNADGTQSPVSALAENPTLQNVLGGLFGGGIPGAAPQRAPAAPQGLPMASPGRPVVSPNEQRAADAESVRMMQAELQNPRLPADQRAGIEREIARLTQASAAPGFPAPSMIRNPQGYGMTNAQQAEAAAQKVRAEANAKLPAQTTDKVNETWLKTSYEPAVSAGNAANDMLTNVQVARQSMRNMGGTGWGTEAASVGASVLAGLGIAPQNAKMFAANAEAFQNAAMSNLQTVLNAAKGQQTEGDSQRASKTFAQLKNTPQANEFILDLAEARARRDAMKAAFFQQALPIARQKGDLQEVEREWMKRAPSVFSMPSMQRWAGDAK